MRVEEWHLAKLLVLQLLDLALQRRCDANVLEQRRVVVQPDLVLLQATMFLFVGSSLDRQAEEKQKQNVYYIENAINWKS